MLLHSGKGERAECGKCVSPACPASFLPVHCLTGQVWSPLFASGLEVVWEEACWQLEVVNVAPVMRGLVLDRL